MGGILVYTPATGEYVELSPTGSEPGWLPDGRTILFRDQGGLWRVDVETRERKLVRRDMPGMQLSGDFVSADGHWIVFEVVQREANIWMVGAEEPAGETSAP
jgi:Tol biopolymer transport system component